MLLRTLLNIQGLFVLTLKLDLATSFWALVVLVIFYYTLQGNFASNEFNVNCQVFFPFGKSQTLVML